MEKLQLLRKLKKNMRGQVPSEGVKYKNLRHSGEKEGIPKDVPKGHLVVYVGEEYKRFVIHVEFLQHPLFQELLDQAQEEFGFGHGSSRLCLPCDEDMFHSILHCISGGGQHGSRVGCPCL